MLRFLKILGIVIGAIVIAVAAGIAFLLHESSAVDQDAQRYADKVVPGIVANWSVSELRREATPELLQAAKPEDLDNLFALFAKLGPLRDYQSAKCSDWNINTSVGAGKVTTVHCTARSSFAEGEATIDLQVRRTGDTWKILRFGVNSSAMIANAVGRSI